MRRCIDLGLIVLMAITVGCSTPQKGELSTKTGHETTAGTPTPPPELASKVQGYNKLLQQAQGFLAKEQVARQEHMRATDKWEAVHGEMNYDKPYPPQLAKLASVSNGYLDKQAQSMEKAADMLQVIKASPDFGKYYREGELAIVDDEVPGLLQGTPAEHLRFARLLQ